jgi:hypothetical protein
MVPAANGFDLRRLAADNAALLLIVIYLNYIIYNLNNILFLYYFRILILIV